MEINWIKPKFWNALKKSNTSSSKKAKSTNLGSIMEREEKRELYWIHCSSMENNVGDDMEGGIWDVCALDVSWLEFRWLQIKSQPPFASSMDLPFGGVFWSFDRWRWKRMKNDDFWALRDVIWLRIEREIEFWSLGILGSHCCKNCVLAVFGISNL